MESKVSTGKSKFAPGEVVAFRSGGAGMTVNKVNFYSNIATKFGFTENSSPTYELMFFGPDASGSMDVLQRLPAIPEVMLKSLLPPPSKYRELDLDYALKVKLDPIGIDAAIEAATDATHAGRGEQEQLLAGIRAYLFVLGGQ